MKNKKIGKVLFGAAAAFSFLTIGNLTVNAEVPEITVPSTNIYTLPSSSSLDPNTIYAKEDSINVGTCSISNPLTIKYKFDNGTEQVATSNFICGSSVTHYNISFSPSQLETNPEHTLDIWVTDSDGHSSNVARQKVLVAEKIDYQDYSDASGIFTVKGSHFPLQSRLQVVKESKQSVIDKVGTTDVYKILFISSNKTYEQFKQEYGLDASVNYGVLTLPSNLTAGPDMLAYLYSSDLSHVDSVNDCFANGDRPCDGKFDYTDLTNAFNGGYVAFKRGTDVYINEMSAAPATTDQVVNVPNTAANTKLILFIVGGVLSAVGVSVLFKNFSLKRN